jgi:hypothetical protein
MSHRPLLAAAAALVLSVTPPARAQEVGDMALNPLEPAPAGDAFVGVPSPFIGGHLVPRALLLLDHASEPLNLTAQTPSGTVEGRVVGRQTFLHIGLSLALWDRLKAELLLPVALAQGGDSPVVQGAPFASPSSAAAGDLRFGLRVRMLGGEEDPFQLAAGAALYVPTGASGVYVGEGSVREAPQLLLGGRLPFLVWSAAVGAIIRTSDNPSALTYGAGVAAVLFDGLVQVGPELFAATPLQQGFLRPSNLRSIPREQVTNAELLLSARVRLPLGFRVGAGGGIGLTDAMGTPAFRLAFSIGWELPAGGAPAPQRDADADGVADEVDACPDAPGPQGVEGQPSGCPAEQAPDPPAGVKK